MTTKGKKTNKGLILLMEEYGPLLASLMFFAIFLYYSEKMTHYFVVGGWQSEGLYTAIFDWSAIQTGFAFGVYGFVVGKTGGFIAALRGTKAMERFISYIWKANIIGFFLTVSSIPLIVVNPKITEDNFLIYSVVSLWFCIFIWSFLSFLRLAYNFGKIVSVKDKEFKGA